MAKKTFKYKPVTTNTDDNSMERSITYFNKNVTNFSSSTDKLVKSIDTFTKSVDAFKKSTEEDKKTKEKDKKDRDKDKKSGGDGTDAPASKNQAWAKKSQKGLDKFQTQASKLGIERLQKFTGDVFGKKATQNMTRGMAKFTGNIASKGAASGGAGMAGAAAKGLGSIAGGVLRMAGPVGAVVGVAKAAFDFWDSGGWANTKISAKMLTGNAMQSASDIKDVESDLEGTEQMRKLNAEYNYKVPMQLRHQADDDALQYTKSIEQDKLQYEQSLVKDKLEYEMGLRKDAMQFQFQQAAQTLDAEMNKRKAIQASGMSFISQYSKISERALQAIGSSTKTILEGVSKFQSIFGGSVKESFELSENAQGLAYHFGVGADDVLNMTNLFRLMGKTSAKTAENLIGGIKEFAKINKLAPQAIFAQIKDAGEDIYKFSSGTAENFVKQAGLLTKMSVSMSQMMKASDSMVLNYKDSIKAEMSLSAMLGKNVNLSEVRARLMSGDQAGAASALKTQLGGMDIGAMNPFQKQALTQATGMDISALMGLQAGKEGTVNGPLTENAKAGKAFADGALQQELSNAGAKLKLEQEQRAKLLKFEQRQRAVMLTLEQSQRLDGIFLEEKWRARMAAVGYERAKEEMAIEAIKENASNFAANQISGTASALNGKNLDTAALADFTGRIQGVDNNLNSLMASGAVKGTDMRLADYLNKKDELLATVGTKDSKGNKVTAEQIETSLTKTFNDLFAADVAAKQAQEAKVAAGKSAELRIQQLQAQMTKDAADYSIIDELTSWGGNTQKNLDILAKKQQYQKEISSLQGVVKEGQTAATTVATQQAKVNADGTKIIGTEIKAGTIVSKDIATKDAMAAKVALTESEYQAKLQQEMVAILGLSAQMLNNIMENTKPLVNPKPITLYGKVLTTQLLNEARSHYAVSKFQ